MNQEEMLKQIGTGNKILEAFSKMSDAELKERLKSICNFKVEASFFEQCDVKRTVINERPERITLYFYDSIEINCCGIQFKACHGPLEQIVTFSENFSLAESTPSEEEKPSPEYVNAVLTLAEQLQQNCQETVNTIMSKSKDVSHQDAVNAWMFLKFAELFKLYQK